MDAVIGGVMVASLLGITYISYKYRRSFQEISFVILIFSGAMITLMASYMLGLTELREAVSWNDEFSSEIQASIGNIADHLQPPHWIWPAAVAAQLYVVFLCFMCRFMRNR